MSTNISRFASSRITTSITNLYDEVDAPPRDLELAMVRQVPTTED